MKKDFLASVVVFLVALPLCMGIAIASGVPVAYGLISGIIGGLVVGFFTGSPLQVSGPAAGLVVLVFDIVQKHGLQGLGIVTFAAGIVQIISAYLKAGPYFRAISPSVIKGMLSGIGVIIFSSQYHVMLDDKPAASAVTNIMTMPDAITKIFDTSLGIPHMEAAFIGVISIFIILLWNSLKDKYHLVVPGGLIGIIAATIIVYFAKLPINKVTLDANLAHVFQEGFIFKDLGAIDWNILWLSIPMAFVATAETLLCTNAVEKMKPDVPVNYNKELLAQGIGNTVCGLFSALPITGVIVRSAANVEAGGETKKSTILHGAWLVLFVVILGGVLKMIPTSALAAILVITGFKLMNFKGLKEEFKVDRLEFAIWLTTTVAIVSTDLLKGIAIGFAFSLVKLLWSIHHLEIKKVEETEEKAVIHLCGKASFLTLPNIANSIEKQSRGKKLIEIDLRNLIYRDTAFNDYIMNLETTLAHKGINVILLDKTSIA